MKNKKLFREGNVALNYISFTFWQKNTKSQ
jgi:hypothetical protein